MAEIRKAHRDKGMSLLSTFPNEIETSHAILAAMVQRRIWLAGHRAETDADELGRTRKQVDDEFWEVWKMYTDTRKPYAVLTEVKVFFDSPEVIAAADQANAAITKEYSATTQDELEADVHEAQALVDCVIIAMSDELNEMMSRPKRPHSAASGESAGKSASAGSAGRETRPPEGP